MDVILAAVLGGVAAGLLAGTLIAVILRRRSTGRSLAASALDALHIGALVVDEQDVVLLCNPAGNAMGLVRGTRPALNELRALAAEARSTGVGVQAEVRLLHGWLPRDPLAVSAHAVPIGQDGQVALVVEDVTEARRVADMRTDFVANVSHELKTPVGALSLLAEALHEAEDDPVAIRRFADGMQRESARLTRLVAELIELSQLEAPESRPQHAPVAISHIIAEAVDRTRLPAEARRIWIHADAEPATWVLGRREQLVTAVVNLLDNAIAYSPERTAIDVAARRATIDEVDCVEISVTDQGIGISEDDLDRVFERFYRADPARSRATGGTGLGLAIVKHVAVNHGGAVRVRSRPGHGSTFTLTVPAAPAEAPAAPAPTGAAR